MATGSLEKVLGDKTEEEVGSTEYSGVETEEEETGNLEQETIEEENTAVAKSLFNYWWLIALVVFLAVLLVWYNRKKKLGN